jgi:uncharacterized protein YdaT
MPWSPSSFKSKHNHKLSSGQASKASSIANAMLKRGVAEGEAIATANARAEGKPRKSRRERWYGK